MARRRAARRGARGGDLVQAPRPTRPRLATGVAAALLWAGLAAYPAHGAGGLSRLLIAGGIVAGLCAGAALVLGWEQLVPWALGLLGAEYAGSLFLRGGGGINDAAPLYAAGLLLLGELIVWSLASRTRIEEERPALLLRLASLAAAVVASIALGALLLAVTTAQVGGGLLWVAIGTAATVGAVALVARAAA